MPRLMAALVTIVGGVSAPLGHDLVAVIAVSMVVAVSAVVVVVSAVSRVVVTATFPTVVSPTVVYAGW